MQVKYDKDIVDLHQDLAELREATNGHTLENTAAIMGALSPEKLEGHRVYSVEVRFEPIVQYLPTDQITDELCQEHGRDIPCEYCPRTPADTFDEEGTVMRMWKGAKYSYAVIWNAELQEVIQVRTENVRILQSTIDELKGGK
jgi:hypothetical protein